MFCIHYWCIITDCARYHPTPRFESIQVSKGFLWREEKQLMRSLPRIVFAPWARETKAERYRDQTEDMGTCSRIRTCISVPYLPTIGRKWKKKSQREQSPSRNSIETHSRYLSALDTLTYTINIRVSTLYPSVRILNVFSYSCHTPTFHTKHKYPRHKNKTCEWLKTDVRTANCTPRHKLPRSSHIGLSTLLAFFC